METAIVCFVIAALSGMGVGSGGLLVIYLTLIEQVPQLTAQGINLLFFLFASGAALLIHATQRTLYYRTVAVMGLLGAVGAILGSMSAAFLPADVLGKIFGTALILFGTLALRGRKRCQKPSKGPENL